jgi:hypothetical protein
MPNDAATTPIWPEPEKKVKLFLCAIFLRESKTTR